MTRKLNSRRRLLTRFDGSRSRDLKGSVHRGAKSLSREYDENILIGMGPGRNACSAAFRARGVVKTPSMTIRYEIRGAGPEDAAELIQLAHYLRTVNLPPDARKLRELLELSAESFSGGIADVTKRKYVFLLIDRQSGSAVGTSTLIARLGRRDAPYIFFDVIDEEKYSKALDKHFYHKLLRLNFSYAGPTELGGLVVLPEYRRAPERLGRLISFVRLLFVFAHRRDFQDELLAELLPPLEGDGKSRLWEALGRRFTDMSYEEADQLSSENKDFIRDLFPTAPIYASLLSAQAQAVIGRVGAQTRGVEKILTRIGFRYATRVDPFDGGPHFLARTDEVSLIRRAQRRIVARPRSGLEPKGPHLLGVDLPERPFFKAYLGRDCALSDTEVALDDDLSQALGRGPREEVLCMPLKLPRSSVLPERPLGGVTA